MKQFILIIIIFSIYSCNYNQEEIGNPYINIVSYKWNLNQEKLYLDCSTNFPTGTEINVQITQIGRYNHKPYINELDRRHIIKRPNFFKLEVPFSQTIPNYISFYFISFEVKTNQADEVIKKLLNKNLLFVDNKNNYFFSKELTDYIHFYEITTLDERKISFCYSQDSSTYNRVKKYLGKDSLFNAPINFKLFNWKLTSRKDSIYSLDGGFLTY